MSDVDVLVIGAGAAGLACSILAGQEGARVCLVEKAPQIGGTTHTSTGQMSAGGTRRQQQRGIHDSAEAHFADVMRISHGTADPTLVRLAVDEAAATIDWLDSLGFEFVPECPVIVHGHEPYRCPRTYWGRRLGKEILEAIRPLFDALVTSGAIDVRLETTLLRLEHDGARVRGALVSHDDRTTLIEARHTVLATGGYASNSELFAELTPGRPRLLSCANPDARGEGLLAAREIGAAVRNGDKYLPTLGGIELAPGSGRADWHGAWAHVYNPLDRAPREIYLNADGRRFFAEDTAGADTRERALAAQPGQRMWVVFDDASIDAGSAVVRGWDGQQLRDAARKGYLVQTAPTVRTLAGNVGLDPDVVEETVSGWNAIVADGRDPLGRRDLRFAVATPPFYALATAATAVLTFGGLHANGDLQVLDTAGVPIPSLFAIGEILGNGALSGNAFCGGMSITPALSFGRWLGRRLARKP